MEGSQNLRYSYLTNCTFIIKPSLPDEPETITSPNLKKNL